MCYLCRWISWAGDRFPLKTINDSESPSHSSDFLQNEIEGGCGKLPAVVVVIRQKIKVNKPCRVGDSVERKTNVCSIFSFSFYSPIQTSNSPSEVCA